VQHWAKTLDLSAEDADYYSKAATDGGPIDYGKPVSMLKSKKEMMHLETPTEIRDDSNLFNKHKHGLVDLAKRWNQTMKTYTNEQDLLIMSSPRYLLVLTEIADNLLSHQEHAVASSVIMFFLMFLYNSTLALLFVCLLIPAFIIVNWQHSATIIDDRLQRRDQLIERMKKNVMSC